MNDDDDDLTRALEAWAAATDPAADPIRPADVTGAIEDPTVGVPTGRSRRLLAVAAAVLAVVGIGAAVVVTRDDGRPDVVTDDGGTSTTATRPEAVAMPLQVVLVNEVGPETTLNVRTFACDPGSPCAGRFVPAQEPGTTSLVYDGTQTDALPLEPAVTAVPCQGGACRQGGVVPTIPLPSCTTDPVPLDEPTRAVLTVTPDGEGIACALEIVDELPALTVPPAFSTRDVPLDPPCGSEAFDAGELPGPADPMGAAAAFGCLEDAVGGGETVELVTTEGHANDSVSLSWWRVLAEPVEGHPIEVFRYPGLTLDGWVRTLCDGFTIPGYGSEVGTPYPCTEEDPVSLAPPPLADGPSAETVDVVLDVDELSLFAEGGARRWSISVAGSEEGLGPLTETGGPPGRSRPDVQLVGDDISLRDGEGLWVSVEDYDCMYSTACRGDGTGPVPGAESVDSCTAEAPADRTGSVLLVTVRGESCDAEWVATLPALTVPPAWSTRPTSDRCGDATWDTWRTCLEEALDAGQRAEWTENGDGSRITFLVDSGVVEIVWRREDEPRWTVQHGCNLEQTGCGPEEELSLEP
ncbi:MAG TPA: hypothetical protein VF228_20085 [Iamia sp.]